MKFLLNKRGLMEQAYVVGTPCNILSRDVSLLYGCGKRDALSERELNAARPPFRSRPTYPSFVKQFALCVGNLEEVIEHYLLAMCCSLELRSGVVVPLESAVDDLGAHVYHVWHDGLVLRTVPSNVSWLSVSVSVGRSVVLVIDGSLSGSPLSVSVGDGWVPGQDLCQVPVEQVWVVDQRLCVERVIVHHDGS